MPASWLIFSGTVLLLISLPWFHVGQAARAGALDWWATVLICVGLALANFPGAVIGLADRHYLDDDSVFHASAAGSAEFLGLMVLLVGVILSAITTTRARVYPPVGGMEPGRHGRRQSRRPVRRSRSPRPSTTRPRSTCSWPCSASPS